MKQTILQHILRSLLYLLVLLLITSHHVIGQAGNTTPAAVKKTFYGQASFYANKFSGRKTSSGEIFDQRKMTCACNAVKLNTWLRITNLRNGKSVLVKANDRLHPGMRRVVDLTRAAAAQLGFINAGVARVKVEVLGRNKPPR